MAFVFITILQSHLHYHLMHCLFTIDRMWKAISH